MNDTTQIALGAPQLEAFYHDEFVDSQVLHYRQLISPHLPNPRVVVDVGGGCGFFARSLMQAIGHRVRVIDMDPISVQACLDNGVEAIGGNALAPEHNGDEDVVCFNLILHHLVGASEQSTRSLQSQALSHWHGKVQAVFVNEYIYDSYFGNLSGRLIYWITSSKRLSALGKTVSVVVKSLRANTFGVGVRFRSHDEWRALFESVGYRVVSTARGSEEHVSAARRLLMIRSCRRDSFLLVSSAGV